METNEQARTGHEVATLGGGCFWCLEAVYDELAGVASVESGYAGGRNANPSYRDVCSGTTGHAEVVRVTFDPSVVTYREILEVFFTIHDPTTLNRQGNDVGTQYRSVIFFHSPGQEQAARDLIAELGPDLPHPIVTEVSPAPPFYEAEAYHQEYYARNPEQGYCQYIISPKLTKFRQKFASRRKV